MTIYALPQKKYWLYLVWALMMGSVSGSYAQGLQLVGTFDFEQGAYIENQKSFYAAIGSNSPFGSYSNRLLKIDPQWGKVVNEFYVGANPNHMRATSDQSALFIVADQPYRLKRFNLQTQALDQDDALEVPEGDRIYDLFSIPNNNKQVLILGFGENGEYLRIFEKGKALPASYQFPTGFGYAMDALFTADSVLWALLEPGVIHRFKIRSDGLHLEKTFNGYTNSILRGTFHIMGDYFVSDAGFYFSYKGEIPEIVGRFGGSSRIATTASSPYFYTLNDPTISGLHMIKYRKQDLKIIDTIFIHTYNYLHPSLRHFQMCTEDWFVVNHFGTVGTIVNCSPLPKKPKIDAPSLLYWCTQEAPEPSLRTIESAYKFYWRKDNAAPKEFSVNDFKINTEGGYSVWVADEKGCLSAVSDPVELRFLSPLIKPGVAHTFSPPQFSSPFQLCKGESRELFTSTFFGKTEWSTGDSTERIKIDKPGIYRVRTHYQKTCYSEWSDPIEITKVLEDTMSAVPVLKIVGVPSGIICSGDSLTFEAPAGYKIYDWDFMTTTKNRITVPTGFNSSIGLRVRVGNERICMSFSSELASARTIFRPTKPIIQRSSNVLISSNTDPNVIYEWYLNGSLLAGENKRLIVAKKEGFYSVRSRTGDCFSLFSDLFSFSGLLTSNKDADQILPAALYPNPAREQIFIQTNKSIDSNLYLTLWDAQGRTQTLGEIHWQEDGLSLNVGHLLAGNYIIQGRSAQQLWVLRFVKL